MTSISILQRWIALDAALACRRHGLDLDRFARRFQVSEKTVRRDLKVFQALGQRLMVQAWEDLDKPRRDKEGCVTETASAIYIWTYLDSTKPLFSANVRPPPSLVPRRPVQRN